MKERSISLIYNLSKLKFRIMLHGKMLVLWQLGSMLCKLLKMFLVGNYAL